MTEPTKPPVQVAANKPATIPSIDAAQIVSAPPSKPLTAEERKQRLNDLRKRMGRSQIEVTAPAGKVAYWAPKDDDKEIGRLTWLGCAIVHDDPKNPAWTANGRQADGTYIIGDVILMECDADLWEMIQEEYIAISDAQRNNAPRNFMEEADAQGVPTFEVKKPRQVPSAR
jgi:hypothetical protein